MRTVEYHNAYCGEFRTWPPNGLHLGHKGAMHLVSTPPGPLGAEGGGPETMRPVVGHFSLQHLSCWVMHASDPWVLGLTVNYGKSSLTPNQGVVFLGMALDSRQMIASPSLQWTTCSVCSFDFRRAGS
ncbi:unnamed protein product [Merluccius merluccius]